MKSILNYIKTKRTLSLGIYGLILVLLHAYFFYKYKVADIEVKQITCVSNVNLNDILIYTTPTDAINANFKNPIHPKLIDNQYVFQLDSSETRSFRIYIGRETELGLIENINLILKDKGEPVLLSDFSYHDINVKGKKQNDFLLFSSNLNGYLELKKGRINLSEFFVSEIVIFLTGTLIFLLSIFVFQNQLNAYTKEFNWKQAFIAVFILSVFLPQPTFNVAFFISFALIVKDFQYKQLISNKMGLLFIGYFLLLVINNLIVSKEFNPKILETSAPLLALPFYVACMRKENYLRIFPLSAFLISLFFISTSALDAVLHMNINCFSFDGFTKYVHPVYFSYLLFFSLIYIEFDSKKQVNKKIFLPVILFALLCCGSKLIISLTVLFYAIQFFKTRILFGSVFIVASVIFILLFSPTRNRFKEIVNMDSLSVLSESSLKSTSDSRLTGVTIRLIIWQESLKVLMGVSDILFGKGVDNNSNQILEDRLIKRGLERAHIKYDPHNQFITTYYKLGLIGLAILLSICIYGYYVAIKQTNNLLLYSMILFTVAMFTESVLQRAVGVYFFPGILLLLFFLTVKPSHLESRHTGN